MKKLSYLAALLPLLFCACSSFIEENSAPIIPAISDLQAGFADETRTYVENGRYLRWHEDDRLTAFYGNTLNRQYKFKGKTGDNSGSFAHVPSGDLETGNAFDRIYALYPYNETTTITDEGEISLTLPALQSYAENSFGRGANTMIAVTENLEDTFLAFKNACGYLKLKLYNADGATIKSIEVKGNNGEKIAGAATATIAFAEAPVLVMADDATDTITIDCGDGVSLGTTAETAIEFWTVIPQTTFTKGITIKITDSQGGIFEKSTDNEVAITRNAIQPMAAVEVKVAPAGPANNEIWYTATKKVEPYNKTVFGANYVSNEWDSETGEGVITFDSEVTKFGNRAFYYYCSDLTSVTIPNSVTSIGDYAFYSCDSLTSITIPDGVTTIGREAFRFCKSLTSATIGDSVTEIGDYAFAACTSLQEFKGNHASEDGRCLIIEGVLELFAPAGITEYTIPDSVTKIGSDAFSYSRLTNVIIPESVTEINERAFFDSGLLNVTIPDNVKTIGRSAFHGCDNLRSVIIGENVESIGNEAFYSCMNLSSVYCKASVPPTLGEYVFYYWNSDNEKERPLGCVKYVPNDSLTLYKSTSGWGSSYGYNYDVISTITYTTSDFEVIVADLPIMSNTYNNGVGELIFYGDLGSLSSNVFYKNVNLASFGGAYASADGRSLIVDGILFAIAPYGLSEYSIPSGVHTIIANAFSGCNQLSSITIPQSVTDIKNNAFANCNVLSSIICYATTPPTIAEGVFTCDSATFYINVPQDYIADYIADPYWSIYESYILAISDRSKYEIGDLVSYNGSEGVVFFVSETVVMLLSTDRTTSNWGLYGTKIGAEDSYNGRNNVIVAKEKGYFNSLPHFVWCENYGDGWYLPASGELKLVRSVYSTISETMTNNGFEGIDGYYRSSTEYGYFDALIVSLTSESTGAVSKNDIYNVRAITAF